MPLQNAFARAKSLPAWECGLKYYTMPLALQIYQVTPCVGVWIEINKEILEKVGCSVTPCVGVWIEIPRELDTTTLDDGHSLRGSVY